MDTQETLFSKPDFSEKGPEWEDNALQDSAGREDHSPSTGKPNADSLSNEEKINLFSGFSKLNRHQKYQRLVQMGALSAESIRYFKSGGVQNLDLADKLIENVIGYFQMPLGVASNFVIDGRSIPIPMAVEETSIVAAASKTARWVKEQGFIRTSSNNRLSIGQIQIHCVKNFENLKTVLESHKKQWILDIHNHVISPMAERGGGVRDFHLRKIKHEKGTMAVVHVLVDTCNAMGANAINQICEYLKEPMEKASSEEVSICILSNLADQCLAQAVIEMKGVDPSLARKIEEASIFAESDPYRAATSNKGVMNGIDAVLMATGNDWRAVEAGVHSYSTVSGAYQSITKWRAEGDRLRGKFLAPLMVGVVGGVTRAHPTAKICMEMMGVCSAEQLARICSAVGLVQNLGALRALTTVGIIEGHMKLHIKNLAQSAGAVGWEFSVIQKHLESLLKLRKRISLSHAVEALRLIREKLPLSEDLKKLTKQEWSISLLKDLRQKYIRQADYQKSKIK